MNRTLKKNILIIESNFDDLKNQFNVKKMAIFGSTVTGKRTKNSDIDIIVEFSNPVGFFE